MSETKAAPRRKRPELTGVDAEQEFGAAIDAALDSVGQTRYWLLKQLGYKPTGSDYRLYRFAGCQRLAEMMRILDLRIAPKESKG